MNRLRKQNRTTEHQRLEEQLSAYLDGELSGQERQAVQRHLATCEECRWDLETLKLTVQWTRELPSAPIPRVFTIPAPTQPARARRQSWSVPLLQRATALVALLLVFVFVGDFALTGFAPAKAPAPVVLMERQAVGVAATQPVVAEATILVEMETATLPAEPEAEAVAEKAAAEAPAPAADAAVATEAAAVEAALPAPTPAPEARNLGAAGLGTPTEAPLTAAQELPLATSTPQGIGGGEAATEGVGAGEVVSLTYAVEVTQTAVVSALPALETPLAVAEAGEPAGLIVEDEAGRGDRGALAHAQYGWLRPTEVVLGSLFILLAAATVVVMVQRRT